MLTVQQIRAARAALRWSIKDLSDASGISVRTIKMIEARTENPQGRNATIEAIRNAIEQAGIEFVGAPDDAPGIRIHLPKPDESK
jgi:transcriptional regulator with XRE-family HTH domain